MRMKRAKWLAVLFFLCAAAFPAWAQGADRISPPAWIEGAWDYSQTFEGGGERQWTILFTSGDIISEGERLSKLIADGELVSFAQETTPSSYEILFEYPDGYWQRQRFERPEDGVMKSVYETSEGESGEEVYTFRKPVFLPAGRTDRIAPPEWIEGVWDYTHDSTPLVLEFTPGDILSDGYGMTGFIAQGEIVFFRQEEGPSYYEICVETYSGSWARERFEKPSGGAMRSVYEGSDSEKGEHVYTRRGSGE
jgi:hypothetical protein